MGAGAVEDHAADGSEEDPQRAHGDDGDEDGVQRLQHVSGAADLVVLHNLWEVCDVHDWKRTDQQACFRYCFWILCKPKII